jgi:hypothetical protein
VIPSRCQRPWRLQRSHGHLTLGANGCGGNSGLRAPLPRRWRQQERQQSSGVPPLGASGCRSDSRAGGTPLCAGGDDNGYDASPPASMPG